MPYDEEQSSQAEDDRDAFGAGEVRRERREIVERLVRWLTNHVFVCSSILVRSNGPVISQPRMTKGTRIATHCTGGSAQSGKRRRPVLSSMSWT